MILVRRKVLMKKFISADEQILKTELMAQKSVVYDIMKNPTK
jgi:hypothetical protein